MVYKLSKLHLKFGTGAWIMLAADKDQGMSVHIEIPQDKMTAFCQRWQIQELALFGSVLRDDFRPDSDVDILVSFDPAARHTLFNMVHMQDELQRLLNRKVDLVSRRGIEMSRNYIRKKAILETAEVVYGA